MFRFALNQRRRAPEGGFTLIELVVVLAILGILVGLAVPRYLGARRKSYGAEARLELQEIKTLEWAYLQQHNVFLAFGAVSGGGSVPGLGVTVGGDAPGKFAYSATTGASNASIVMMASGFGADQPWSGITMSLNLTSTGNSTLTESF